VGPHASGRGWGPARNQECKQTASGYPAASNGEQVQKLVNSKATSR
jgi:hypothetical protein